jgi:hypothetical protein
MTIAPYPDAAAGGLSNPQATTNQVWNESATSTLNAVTATAEYAPTQTKGGSATTWRDIVDTVATNKHRRRIYDAANALARTIESLAAAITDTVVGTYTMVSGGALTLDGSSVVAKVAGVARATFAASATTISGGDVNINGTTGFAAFVSGGIAQIGGATGSHLWGANIKMRDYASGDVHATFQWSAYVATTNATQTTLLSLTPSATRPSAYEVFVLCEDASGNMKAWLNTVPARGQSGAAAFAGAASPIAGAVLGTPDAALNTATMELDTSTTTVRVRGTGIAATNLTWFVFVREIF